MAHSSRPTDRGDVIRQLHSLIETQNGNLNDYRALLRLENEALAGGDDEKLLLYRKLEVAGREKIVGTGRSLRELKAAAALTGREMAGFEPAEAGLEALRLEALKANASTQDLLRRKMHEVKTELDALGATLRRLDAGQRPAGADPIYIDVYS
jgi:hypothetical protein